MGVFYHFYFLLEKRQLQAMSYKGKMFQSLHGAW